MWLKVPWPAANEALLRLVNQGYDDLLELEHHCDGALRAGKITQEAAVARARDVWGSWLRDVNGSLSQIFPSIREMHLLRRIVRRTANDNGSVFGEFWAETERFEQLIGFLDQLRLGAPRQYPGAPPSKDQLYIEDIDSFAQVRDINPRRVAHLLNNGRIDLLEDVVQQALEQILGVPFHRLDHGGEANDLFTDRVKVNGQRARTAFMLKGRGCRSRELQISDCGKNGDQLVRLFNSPAELFVVQYIGPISDAVIADLVGKVAARRAAGRSTWFTIIDGQDTVRLLKAYDYLDQPNLALRGGDAEEQG